MTYSPGCPNSAVPHSGRVGAVMKVPNSPTLSKSPSLKPRADQNTVLKALPSATKAVFSVSVILVYSISFFVSPL